MYALYPQKSKKKRKKKESSAKVACRSTFQSQLIKSYKTGFMCQNKNP